MIVLKQLGQLEATSSQLIHQIRRQLRDRGREMCNFNRQQNNSIKQLIKMVELWVFRIATLTRHKNYSRWSNFIKIVFSRNKTIWLYQPWKTHRQPSYRPKSWSCWSKYARQKMHQQKSFQYWIRPESQLLW